MTFGSIHHPHEMDACNLDGSDENPHMSLFQGSGGRVKNRESLEARDAPLRSECRLVAL